MLKEVEASITGKLRELLTTFGVKLEPFPDKPSELGKPSPTGQVLIGYKRSSFRLLSKTPLTLEQLAEFEINLQLKNLRNHTGAYPILDRIRFGLTGFVPMQGASLGMYPTAEGFADLDESIWYYNQTFVIPLLIVEGQELYEILPPPEEAWGEDLQIRVNSGIWRSPIHQVNQPVQLDRVVTVEPIVPNPTP
jgi:hypothetical protein